jgi:hypothetical protein
MPSIEGLGDFLFAVTEEHDHRPVLAGIIFCKLRIDAMVTEEPP